MHAILKRSWLLTFCSLFVSLFASAQPNPQDIIINEIYFNPPNADDLEFIELLNISDKTFDLKDLRFKDDTQTIRVITPSSLLLGPKAYVVLVKDAALFNATYTGIPVLQPSSWPSLNNDKDSVILLSGSTVIDQVAYSSTWGGTDVSLERIDPNSASNASTNWASCLDPAKATPSKQNSVYLPDTTPPRPVFARQSNAKTIHVTFNEPLLVSSVIPTHFKMNGLAAEAALISADGFKVTLTFSSISGTTLQIENVQDLAKNRLSTAILSISRLPEPQDLVINEILFDPKADSRDNLPDQTEFIELYNRSSASLDLSGLFWTNLPDETGAADTLRIPNGVWSVPAKGYVLLSAEPTAISSPSGSKLAKAFSSFDFTQTAITFIPVLRSSLSLDNGGDTIRLHRADKTVLDEVSYTPKWHHPNLLDTKGVSLERIHDAQPAQEPSNWISSFDLTGATPGVQNSAFIQIPSLNENNGLSIAPSPFSPDGDGIEEIAAIQYRLESTAALVRTRIFDAQGRLVRTLEQARLTNSEGVVFWDGYDEERHRVRIGIYIVYLEAVDGLNGKIEAYKAPVVVAKTFN